MSTSNSDTNDLAGVEGKGILITGGTSGIGRATAILLAQKGANVFVAGSKQEHLDDTLESIAQAGPQGKFAGIAADLSTGDGIQQIFNINHQT